VLPLLELGKDSGLLAFAFETPHGVLEGFIFFDMDQRHEHSPPYPSSFGERYILRKRARGVNGIEGISNKGKWLAAEIAPGRLWGSPPFAVQPSGALEMEPGG